MTRRLVLSCVLAASLGLGERALALSISDPITGASCANLFESDSMGDPSQGPFSLAPQAECIKLCKRATSQCKSFTKKNYSCFLTVVASHVAVVDENCKLGAADPKVCILEFKDEVQSDRAELKTQLGLALAACDTWGTACLATCGP